VRNRSRDRTSSASSALYCCSGPAGKRGSAMSRVQPGQQHDYASAKKPNAALAGVPRTYPFDRRQNMRDAAERTTSVHHPRLVPSLVERRKDAPCQKKEHRPLGRERAWMAASHSAPCPTCYSKPARKDGARPRPKPQRPSNSRSSRGRQTQLAQRAVDDCAPGAQPEAQRRRGTYAAPPIMASLGPPAHPPPPPPPRRGRKEHPSTKNT